MLGSQNVYSRRSNAKCRFVRYRRDDLRARQLPVLMGAPNERGAANEVGDKLAVARRLHAPLHRQQLPCEVDMKPHDNGQYRWRYKHRDGEWRAGFSFGALESLMTVEELINSHYEW